MKEYSIKLKPNRILILSFVVLDSFIFPVSLFLNELLLERRRPRAYSSVAAGQQVAAFLHDASGAAASAVNIRLS